MIVGSLLNQAFKYTCIMQIINKALIVTISKLFVNVLV